MSDIPVPDPVPDSVQFYFSIQRVPGPETHNRDSMQHSKILYVEFFPQYQFLELLVGILM